LKILTTTRIWDKAPHNAFTDLIKFKGSWYCGFREGETHMSNDGKLRVIRSNDGKVWQTVALFNWQEGDLRDAKFSITPTGQLMMNGGVRFVEVDKENPEKKQVTFDSITWFSGDGESWSEPFVCSTGKNTWRWSVTWHKGVAYSFGYTGKDQHGCLYHSKDGKSWRVLKQDVYPDIESYANESSIGFDGDKACCLLRRDKGSTTGLLGISFPPYKEWEWHDLGVHVGGPKMVLEGGQLLAAVRLLEPEERTSLCWIDPQTYTLTEAVRLQSGDDSGYAGLVVDAGVAWVSYYSSHEEKTAIYLAQVEL